MTPLLTFLVFHTLRSCSILLKSHLSALSPSTWLTSTLFISNNIRFFLLVSLIPKWENICSVMASTLYRSSPLTKTLPFLTYGTSLSWPGLCCLLLIQQITKIRQSMWIWCTSQQRIACFGNLCSLYQVSSQDGQHLHLNKVNDIGCVHGLGEKGLKGFFRSMLVECGVWCQKQHELNC